MHGASTSPAKITNVSKHGLWLRLGDEELYLSFGDFPWFRAATIDQICTVEQPTAEHLYWPSLGTDLDIDLAVESIRNPASFPLVFASRTE